MKAELRNEVLHIPGLTNHLGASVRARARARARRYSRSSLPGVRFPADPETFNAADVVASLDRRRRDGRERGREQLSNYRRRSRATEITRRYVRRHKSTLNKTHESDKTVEMTTRAASAHANAIRSEAVTRDPLPTSNTSCTEITSDDERSTIPRGEINPTGSLFRDLRETRRLITARRETRESTLESTESKYGESIENRSRSSRESSRAPPVLR